MIYALLIFANRVSVFYLCMPLLFIYINLQQFLTVFNFFFMHKRYYYKFICCKLQKKEGGNLLTYPPLVPNFKLKYFYTSFFEIFYAKLKYFVNSLIHCEEISKIMYGSTFFLITKLHDLSQGSHNLGRRE